MRSKSGIRTNLLKKSKKSYSVRILEKTLGSIKLEKLTEENILEVKKLLICICKIS